MNTSASFGSAWPRHFQAFLAGAVVGALGGLIGLGGAEFRLPLLIGLFGFVALHAGDAFKFIDLFADFALELLFALGQAFLDAVELPFFFIQRRHLAVELIALFLQSFFALEQAFFNPHLFAAALFELVFEIFFHFQQLAFGGYFGLAQNMLGFFFRVAADFAS